MSVSSFRINQPPATGYTYWDRSRRDISLGDVECEAQNKSESSYLWEMISGPPGETIVITNPTSHTCEFTLSTRYGYLIRLTVNQGEIDESATTLYIGVALLGTGGCLPALNETNQDNSQSPYDGSRGTEEKINDLLIKFDNGVSWDLDVGFDVLQPISSSTRLRSGNGTVDNPSIQFNSDIDTGLYLVADGEVGLSSGGAKLFSVKFESGDPIIDFGSTDFELRSTSVSIAGANLYAVGDAGSSVNVMATSSSGAAVLNLDANGVDASSFVNIGGAHCRISIEDYLKVGSSYSGNLYVSNSQSEWNDFVSNYGSVSILNAINQSSNNAISLGDAYNEGSSIVADTSSVSISTPSGATYPGLFINSDSVNLSGPALELRCSSISPLLRLSDSYSIYMEIHRYQDDGIHICMSGTSPADNNNLILTTSSNAQKSHERSLSSDPTLFLFSSVDVDSDSTKWMSLCHNGSCSEIQQGSGFLSIGAQSTNHGLSNNGDLVTGNIEVSLNTYLDGDMYVYGASMFEDTMSIRLSSVDFLKVRAYGDDGVHFGVNTTTDQGNGNIIITSIGNIDIDHNHDTVSNDPCLFLHSATSVSSDDTQWIGISRSASKGRVFLGGTAGSTYLHVEDTLMIGRSLTGESVETLSVISNNVTIDFEKSNFFYCSVGASINTWSVSDPRGPGFFIIRFYSTISGIIDSPSGWRWSSIGGSAPFTVSASQRYAAWIYFDGGSYYALWLGVLS
jgi:hypothetical protein